MENASKALLIAGALLLTMLVLSLLILLANNLQTMGMSEDEKIAAQQLTAFNNEYEAYNKKLLYGTDVITVVNKAIDNNKKVNEDPEHYFFIDVELHLISDFYTTTIKVTTRSDGTQGRDTTKERYGSLSTGTYNLRVNSSSTQMNSTIIKFFNLPANDPAPTLNGNVTTYTYSALTDFKRAIFTCNGTEYDSNTGRVNKIIFTQTDVATYE